MKGGEVEEEEEEEKKTEKKTRQKKRSRKLNARGTASPRRRRVAVSRRGMIMVAGPRNPWVMDHDLWYTAECPVMR